MISDDEYQELAIKWSYLFQKAPDETFSISKGWLPIIDKLCGQISENVETAMAQLGVAKMSPEKYSPDLIRELEKTAELELQALPVIKRCTGHNGKLEFIVDSNDEKIAAFIAAATEKANRSCQICGMPGEIKHYVFTRVLCPKHHVESITHVNTAVREESAMTARNLLDSFYFRNATPKV